MRYSLLLFCGFLACTLRAAAQTIGPDASFGTGGTTTTQFGFNSGYAQALAIQPDQKLVVAGTTNPVYDFVVNRYLPSGQLDPTFGVSGVQIFNFGFSLEECNAVAVQRTDSKIILGGVANGDYALLRLLPNGQPDNTFDGDGRVQLSFGAGNGSTIEEVLVQPDGKIVAVGWAYNGTNFDFAAARFLANGAPDVTFGTGGFTRIPLGPERDQGRAGLLQPDGKIVIAGASYSGTPTEPRFGICRLLPNGTLDTSFGTGGKTVSTLGAVSHSVAWCVARQPDGKLLMAGEADGDMALARYTAAGALDTGFGTNGYRISDFAAGSQDKCYAILLQPNGKVLIGGLSFTTRPNAFHDFSIARYTTTGALDATFGTGGSLKTVFGYASQVQAAAFQADGKPVFAGTYSTQSGPVQFALLRLTSAGLVGLADDEPGALTEATVSPNPLTTASEVRYTLAEPALVTVELLDALGRRVRLLCQSGEKQAPGPHALPMPETLAPGVYVVRLTLGDQTRSLRVVR